jgi:NAD-dependent SIR2 family protein deacetylase
MPKPESLFELDYYKSKPEAFTKFANQFLINESLGVVDPTVTHILAEYLSKNKLLMKYFTINIENTEMKLKIPDTLITHVLGRVSPFGNKLPASYCLKCNKKIDVEKV